MPPVERRALAVALAALALAAAGPPVAQAASTQRVLLDWTEGTLLAGLSGAGSDVWPEDVPAPDHVRVPFNVTPCHRDLSPGLTYEPQGVFVHQELQGNEVFAGQPYRFQLTLLDPSGATLRSTTIDENDTSIGGPTVPFYTVDAPGTYSIELELLEGAAVDWRLRVRGFTARDEPTCDLWLNEVELNPPGPDAGREWVELYNAGTQPVDVGGWTIRGRGNATGLGNRSFAIPSGTTVPAGGYTVVGLTGREHLDDVNETVQLVPPTGGVLDTSPALDDTGGNADTNQRLPDGSTTWGLREETRGSANPSG